MHNLELLEDRIRKAAELIRTLREERTALERRLAARENEIEVMRARAPEGAGEDDARELQKLRTERKEILARVNRMLGILDEAAALSGEEDLLAAVDEME